MNEARNAILQRVKQALAPLATRAAYPEYSDDILVRSDAKHGGDLWTLFSERLKGVSGKPFSDANELVSWLESQGHKHGYCDPALLARLAPAFAGRLEIETQFARSRIDDYAFGITQAAGAIAETGTLILKDATTSSRLAALAPWVHIAVLSRETIHPDLAAAVAALGNDPNIIWCTGPSKTADVEGILIEGVHGPGCQIALLV
ncbi:MAG: LUD domain-containing protein [Opitutaceae bacterium]